MATARNAKGSDLFCVNDDETVKFSVQSKGLSKRDPVGLGTSLKNLRSDWWIITALLHKSGGGRRSPFPGQTYPATSVMGVPSAVKPFKTATRTWNSAT